MFNNLSIFAWVLGIYFMYINTTWLALLSVLSALYFTFHILPLAFGLESLRGEDGFLLFEEPNNKLVASVLLINHDRISFKKFRKNISQSLSSDKRSKMCLVNYFGIYYWKPAFHYEESKHYILHKERVTKPDMQNKISEFANKDMNYDYPPYEFHVYKNYEENKSAVIFRFHHCFVDGLAVSSLISMASDKKSVTDVYKSKALPLYKSVLIYFVASFMAIFYLVASLIQPKNKNPLKTEKLTGVKQVDWSKKIDVKKVLNYCKANKCTLNDYLTSAIIKALNTYTKGKMNKVTALIPISLRGYSNDGSMLKIQNYLTVIPVTFNADSENILKDCVNTYNSLKSSAKPLSYALLVRWLVPILPFWIMKNLTLFLVNKATFMFSNVASTREPIVYDGKAFEYVLGFSPNSGKMGFSMTSVSYINYIVIACYADTAVIEKPGDLLKLVENQIAEDLNEEIFLIS